MLTEGDSVFLLCNGMYQYRIVGDGKRKDDDIDVEMDKDLIAQIAPPPLKIPCHPPTPTTSTPTPTVTSVTWRWQNDSTWVDFPPEITKRLEDAFSSKRKRVSKKKACIIISLSYSD